jgi:hypothetical protein
LRQRAGSQYEDFTGAQLAGILAAEANLTGAKGGPGQVEGVNSCRDLCMHPCRNCDSVFTAIDAD